MSRSTKRFAAVVRAALAAAAFALTPLAAQAGVTDLSDIPMAVLNSVKANFLVVLDNSQSMDAFMGGTLQAGDNENTRGNIGRKVLRKMLLDYGNTFRWGVMSFDAPAPSFRYTHVYYLGNDSTMVFTDDCVGGVSATNGGRRCVSHPQPFAGGNFVTYDTSSDDPMILDVLYTTESHPSIWAISQPGSAEGSSNYNMYFTHSGELGSAWAPAEFANFWFTGFFSPTDAGYIPSSPQVTRQLFMLRSWGFRSEITGGGKLWVPAAGGSAEHDADLALRLANEKIDQNSKEIKNAAVYTPLAGTLASARNYFSGQADWRSTVQYSSPISAWCQKNFVMLVTDGMPTGNKSGGLYTGAQRTDSCSAWNAEQTACTGSWTFGAAATETLLAVDGLRSVPYAGCDSCSSFDVQTYVVAMGETVANARAVAVMNEMAARGGSEKAFFAGNSEDMQIAIETAARNALDKTGAAAAVAVSNAIVTKNTVSFESTYYSGNWSGDLKAFALDTATGALKEPKLWSAQERLNKQTASERKIASYSCASGTCQGIRFQPAGSENGLSEAEQALLSTTDGAGIVNFIRGDDSGETATPQKYRARTSVLGDIINSEPVFVATPSANYSETSNPGYPDFKTSQASRSALVFQGANDGMLHAFNATSGDEAWAYVPSLVLPTLANLSRRFGFSHKYYVDGTPAVGDVDFARTVGATAARADWRTILVGGLGKGGRGYYALDVTGEAPTTEAGVAAQVLWEFPNSSTDPQVVANLGYSFGKPVIAKVGDQGWVVLVSSGYNNSETITVTAEGASTTYTGDGKGHLFVLNARTGALIKDISTSSGGTASPSGLASFSAYVESADVDNTVPQVYAGDLDGNVWRFDLTGTAATWNVKKLASLVDESGTAQPVTTAPELATIFEDGVAYRFVYVGTGRYLGDNDVTTTAAQTMYGLIDDHSATPLIDPLRSKLQQQTLTAMADPQYREASNTKFKLSGDSRKRGWYVDLPVAGERISTDPQLAFGALVFTSNIPSLENCVPGGSSYFNILDYRTGGLLDGTRWSSHFLGNALASRPVLMRLGSGEVIAVIRMSDGSTRIEDVRPPPPTPPVRRVSWRELPDSAK